MTTPSSTITGLKILVVEDEGLIAEEICDRLSRAGCHVIATAGTGVAAVEAALSLHPDLILMDVHLKGDMDGIRAAELIEQQYRVPVIYLTAHSDQGTLQRAKANHAAGYILKPFHVKNLLVAIEVAMHRFEIDQQLEFSQLTYASILSSVSDGVIATDINGCVRFINPVAERLTGWSIRDAHGKLSHEILRFADSADLLGEDHLVERVLATRSPITLDNDEHVLSRDNLLVPVDGVVSPVIDGLGRLVGTTVTLRDMAVARRADADLKAMAAQLRAVLDTAVDGVMLLDAAGQIRLFNPAVLRLFGYTKDELATLRADVLMSSPLTDVYGRSLRGARSGRRAVAFLSDRPTVGRRKDGTSFPAELSVGETVYEGQPVFVCVIHDDSDRQALEAELLDAIGHEQRRLGRDLHDSLGQELTGLSLLVEAIARSARHSEIPDPADLERVQEVVKHAIKSCRSIARGLSPVDYEQGGLVSGLRELVGRLNTPTGPSIDFTTVVESKLGLSPAATDHLYRIAQEAIANALRHAHATAIRVTLDVEPKSVRLEICDDGDGLEQPALSGRSGLGLRTMRYRASSIGARLQITALDPAGTCVVCECPQAA